LGHPVLEPLEGLQGSMDHHALVPRDSTVRQDLMDHPILMDLLVLTAPSDLISEAVDVVGWDGEDRQSSEEGWMDLEGAWEDPLGSEGA
jgi:hypothetical protein